jgi:hypothetical protein
MRRLPSLAVEAKEVITQDRLSCNSIVASRTKAKFAVRRGAHSTFFIRTFLYLRTFLYPKAVGRAYVRIRDVASTNLYERNKEATRWCTEAKKRGTGASKKKPADSSTERISTVGRRLSPAASGVGREK